MQEEADVQGSPAPTAGAAPAAAPARVAHAFEFTGSARDYFLIWIVNLLLTIVTLGIYSPWAKVRKKRYLYQHTWVAGSNFDYHGDPWAILRGRLIAFTAFVAYSVGGQFSPRTAATVLLALMPAVPWLILRSFAFNAANSSWRNMRFRYEGRYSGALKAIAPFVAVPVGTLLFPLQPGTLPSAGTIGLAVIPGVIFMLFYPWVRSRLTRLRLDGTSFGDARFACAAQTGSFYGIYFVALIGGGVVMLVLGAASVLVAMATRGANVSPEIVVVLLFLSYLVVGVLVLAFTQSQIGNLVVGSVTLAREVRFQSKLKTFRLMRIYALNLFAILLSGGLLVPWAVVRTLRYRASCVSLDSAQGFDHFAARAVHGVTAAGEEFGDMFAIDVSL